MCTHRYTRHITVPETPHRLTTEPDREYHTNVEMFSECIQMILYTSLDMMFMFQEHRPTVTDANILCCSTSHYACESKSKVMCRMSLNIHHITKQSQ